MNNLEKFLEEKAENYDLSRIKLPIFHSCTFDEIVKYIDNGHIELKECDVFCQEKFIYFFLGKARFLKEIPSRSLVYVPVSIAIRPNAEVDVFRVYPFDTGAVVLDKYQPVIAKDEIEIVKQEYKIGKSLPYAYSLIDIFFDSHSDYIKEKVKDQSDAIVRKTAIAKSVSQLEKINSIYKGIDVNADGRKTTIELHVKGQVTLDASTISHILIPTDEFYENEKLKSFLEIEKTIKPIFYATVAPLYQDAYYFMILLKSLEISDEYAS